MKQAISYFALIGGLFVCLITLGEAQAPAVELDDGTDQVPALSYRSQPGYGFHKTGQSTMTLPDGGSGQCSDTYLCTPHFTLDATLKIEGERDNLSGYFFVIQGHNNKSDPALDRFSTVNLSTAGLKRFSAFRLRRGFWERLGSRKARTSRRGGKEESLK
ncbi:MAG: hypothetical protein EPO39_01340 [Candidatus Manganitrophaceae bacterium]|nr:MAG: hypothetical protein EPO39_01340 [Candidatus Manganitrophaceae bacterium]